MLAGWASEAAVVLLEPTGQHNRRRGEGRCFVDAFVRCGGGSVRADASASPAVRGSSPRDRVRALQHSLYREAKADPGRRFHALMDKVYRREVLARAWFQVRRNDGAPGIDRVTLSAVEEYGLPGSWTSWQRPCGTAVTGLFPRAESSLRRSASCADCFGRNPKLHGKKCASNTSSITSFTAAYATRSRTAGIDNGRRSPGAPGKSSSMRLGAVGGGWWRRISPAVSRRFRSTG